MTAAPDLSQDWPVFGVHLGQGQPEHIHLRRADGALACGAEHMPAAHVGPTCCRLNVRAVTCPACKEQS